jgi:hypothetical protein
VSEKEWKINSPEESFSVWCCKEARTVNHLFLICVLLLFALKHRLYVVASVSRKNKWLKLNCSFLFFYFYVVLL